MNPGGDFGKRELSPALRSRFTEVSVIIRAMKCQIRIVCSSVRADFFLAIKVLDKLS